jgi:hypothetical protein
MLETLFGGVLGGLFRLAPEVLKWLDRKGERQHELFMLQAEMEFAKIRGEIAMKQTEAIMTTAELSAMSEAYKEQAATATQAGRFVSALSALVRPLVTYAFVGTYFAVKAAAYALALHQGGEWKALLVSMWNQDDMAMLMLILTFWFVGRVYEKQRGA